MNFTRQTLAFETEAAWLEARKLDLTSTECAALFGASPYTTLFELHHVKAGTMAAAEFQDNDRMRWGRRLESAIAHGVAEDLGLIVEPFKVYMRIPELRMGSSFDFKIIGIVDGYDGDQAARDMFRQHGAGIMEIKNVDGLQFKRGWVDDGETIEAPAHIECQVQHQLEVADMGWSIIAPLVGGNTPRPILRVRDQAIGGTIRLAVAEFWNNVDYGTAPSPDYLTDSVAIKRLHVNNDGSAIDLSDDARLAILCATYKAAGADAKAAEERKQAALAEIITRIGAAKTVQAAGYKVSAGTNKESYRYFERAESVRWTITRSVVPPSNTECMVEPFRNVRISEII